MKRWLVTCYLLLVLCLPAFATNYYVSTSGSGTTCSQASPCGLISTGIGKLAAGDTLYLRGGTYTERISSNDYPFPSGTSWTNAITIASYPSETATLMPTTGPNTIILNAFNTGYNLSYIIFDRLVVDGTYTTSNIEFFGDTGGTGPQLHHIRFQNGEVRNAKTVPSPGTQTSANNVHMAGDAIEFLSSRSHHAGSGYGFYMIGHNNLIDGCEIDHNYGFGIQIYSNPRPPGTINNTIRNNRIHDNGVIGNVFGATGLTVNHVDDTKIYNNLFYDNNYGCMNVGAGNPNNTQILHNTFFRNGAASGSAQCVELGFAGTTPTNTQIKNNIFWQNNGTVYINQATGTVQTGNSTANPQFVNTTTPDLHLVSTSPVIDVVSSAGILSDLEGTPRPQGSLFDTGAYEFSGTPPPVVGTYYVSPGGHGETSVSDTNSCATATHILTPKRTFASVIPCLASGSTLYARGGVYGEVLNSVTTPIAAGTSWATATIIASYPSETAILQNPGISSSQIIFLHNPTTDHYLIFDRLRLDGNNVSQANGLVASSGADHIRFQNGDIRNTTYEGVYISQANQIEILRTTFPGSFPYAAIAVGGCTGCLIQGNTITSGQREGIAHIVGLSNTNVTLDSNSISGTGAAGGPTPFPGIVLGSSTGAKAINNLLWGNAAGLQVLTGTSGPHLYNNTITDNTGFGLQIDSGATGTLVTNDIVYNNGSGITNNGTSTVQTTNLTTNPTFVNAATHDYRLQTGSAAKDTGTTLAEVPLDALNVPRPQGPAYDKGAYEYVADGSPPRPPTGLLFLN